MGSLLAGSDDLALLEACAREAGEIARAAFGGAVQTWSKGVDGPVTEVDLAIDRLLNERLRSARPAYGWLSEETADNAERLDRERVFIVDPIDGTRAFIAGLPEFTISLGLVEREAPVLGVVYNPVRDEMFVGGVDTPATLNGAPIHVTARGELEGARMIGRQGFFSDARWPQAWPALELEWRHSIAYRLSLVAAGAFDGAVMLGYKNEWDMAAGAAILNAAGGRLTDMFGAAIPFNQADPRSAGAVAAPETLHTQLVTRLEHLPHPRDWTPGRSIPPKREITP